MNSNGKLELQLKNCDLNALREVLYQIYPTHRPIFADFQLLTQGAINLSVETVLDRLIEHIINYDHVYTLFGNNI